MVKFRNFYRDGNILESDVIINERGVDITFHARYNIQTREMEYIGEISKFAYTQGLKGFAEVSYQIRKKGKCFGKGFDIAWG